MLSSNENHGRDLDRDKRTTTKVRRTTNTDRACGLPSHLSFGPGDPFPGLPPPSSIHALAG